MSSPLLSIRGLHSAFGGPFDMEIGHGECVAVLGKSGSGKSVLLRLIADMDPGTGEVELEGRSRDSWPAPEWRRRVVYQAAEPAWWAPTAGDHFRAADATMVEALLPGLDVAPELLRADVARQSTGERQRLALVRSLVVMPRVLLLDEPTAALDAASVRAVEALLRSRLEAGLAVLLVTHAQEQARRMGERVFEMIDGVLHPR